jgi:hypothetical protein
MSLLPWPVRPEKHPHPQSGKRRLNVRAAEVGSVSHAPAMIVILSEAQTVTHTIVLFRLSCCNRELARPTLRQFLCLVVPHRDEVRVMV